MHEFPWLWVLFGILFWMFLIRPGRLRACQARWSTAEGRDAIDGQHVSNRHRRRERGADVETALAERDAMIAKLEERVRVLERIATDGSARLRAEIESLRDPPEPRS